ncbi:hypothetical protein H5410_052462 [Solanum commersonii]|uniref:Uncharacterized protein n=1 Tax=Solanum commersonii TaxID=4109 RepID=A0A9J5X163_SOLCO|nr:hypothetical protein H5410_052462 [Solanum commersonii]
MGGPQDKLGFSNLPEENAEGIGSSEEDIPHFGDEESRVAYIGVRPSKIASVLITQAGGVENLNLTGRDIQNYLSTKRQKNLEKRDVQLMLKYFQKRQSKIKALASFMQYKWM